MKRVILMIVAGLALIVSTGCTDAQRAKIGALGSGAYVTCYSGGKMIYDGESTGKISSEESSDGYYFRDAEDGKLKEVSGNCIITYKD